MLLFRDALVKLLQCTLYNGIELLCFAMYFIQFIVELY